MEKQENNAPKIVLAFDFGLKKIGVAIGQTITQSARPLDTLLCKHNQPNWDAINRLIKKWLPDILVVGIPLNMDGTEQKITQQTRLFIAELKTRFNLPVAEMDERLTTKAAREELFKKGGFKALQDGQVDRVAAQLILQNWFEEKLKS